MSFYTLYITPLLTDTFLWGLRTYNVIKDSWMELLKQNPPLQWAVSEAQYGTLVIYCFLTATRMEPRELPWLATYGVMPKEVGITNRFSLIENINPFFTSYFFEDLFGGQAELEYTLKYISAMGSRIGSSMLSPLVVIKGIYKGESIYLVRKGPFYKADGYKADGYKADGYKADGYKADGYKADGYKADGHSELPMESFSWKKVATPFLSVEYTHPEMNEAIELKMDAGFFREGNELFTPAFVLRLLEYQYVPYYFDEDYTIRVMDTQCNIIDLTSSMYIVITENGYECRMEEVFPQDDGYVPESDSSEFVCITKDESHHDKKND